MEDNNELIVSYSWTSEQLSVRVFCMYSVCCVCLPVHVYIHYNNVLCMIVTDTLWKCCGG